MEVNNRGSYLVFECIKGHSNIRGNEEVIRAAKLADGLPEITSTRPLVATQKWPEKLANKMWQRQWSSPKTTTAFFVESRAEQVSLSKIRLDKLNLNYKLFNKETCTDG
ncbi:hypothetical protein DAPPUDRAFT_106649 [Daphnia pulex]|uniref:RNase H type-1 domain-containing protein n=1 Tax=Daphnia pulex TaxID=6669 RepID=E9GUL7_DAPPU|nr:hypothetical protein DAPPUDRAFT_106649 [Daphnia pulex]|eukprot:EFX76749.1 hypothetical protein DAPPUDRAFT_106649 [Daphnia pulex]